MKTISTLLIGLFSCFFALTHAVAEEAPEVGKIYIDLILDASNSMNEKVEGTAKIVTAKQVVTSLLTTLDPGIQLALRVYGINFDPLGTKEKACKDSQLIVPFGASSRTQISSAIQGVAAKGYTPIAYSLEQSVNDFASVLDAKKVIVLVSDGKESCGGDPCAVARALKSQGLDVVIHAIGFAVDEEARNQLSCLAQATGGQYFDAKNAEGLQESFKQVQAQVQTMVGTKSEWSYNYEGKEITPASACGQGPALGSGKYVIKNLARSQGEKLGQIKHCVIVPLKASQNLVVKSTLTGVVGPKTSDNTTGDLDYSINLWGGTDQQLWYEEQQNYKVSAFKPLTTEFSVDASQEQNYCLSYSTNGRYEYSPAGFNAGIEIVVTDCFDVDSGRDAPASFADALPIEAKKYPVSYLLTNDLDRFTLPVTPGTLSIKIIPEEDKRVRLELFHEDRDSFWAGSSNNEGAIIKFEGKIEKAETLYLQVSPETDISAWVKGEKKWGKRAGKYELNISFEPTPASTPVTLAPEK